MDREDKTVLIAIVSVLLTIGFLICFVYAGIRAIDKHFDDQDTMLCHSAKVSENEEYLVKCKCYYEGENIRCIYKENK